MSSSIALVEHADIHGAGMHLQQASTSAARCPWPMHTVCTGWQGLLQPHGSHAPCFDAPGSYPTVQCLCVYMLAPKAIFVCRHEMAFTTGPGGYCDAAGL